MKCPFLSLQYDTNNNTMRSRYSPIILFLHSSFVHCFCRAIAHCCCYCRYGPGPHYVEISIVLPTESNDHVRTFLLEMAPLASMPHSVNLFLEQVSHNLWNNAYFYLNGPHVLQGGPQAEHGWEEATGIDARELALRPFREVALAHLAFPEYSNDFPHVPWSVGFTGRPGGPDFYINKMDNTIVHGPGGQLQHDLDEFGDPCFAKVVDGFDTLHAIFRLSTYADDSPYKNFMEQPVRITKAVVKDAPATAHVEANLATVQSQGN
jgi:hypothetical protein